MYSPQDLYSFIPDKDLAKFGYNAYSSTKHVLKQTSDQKCSASKKTIRIYTIQKPSANLWWHKERKIYMAISIVIAKLLESGKNTKSGGGAIIMLSINIFAVLGILNWAYGKWDLKLYITGWDECNAVELPHWLICNHEGTTSKHKRLKKDKFVS